MAKPLLRYEQVMQLIETLIAERGLAPGDRLPTNQELAQMGGVSLISVRRALDELERADRVVRHQGVGTFVAGPPIVSEPGRAGGLLATLTEGEGAPAVETSLLSVTRGIAGPTIARVLGPDPAPSVWEITRLRRIRGRAMILERAVLPVALVPTIDEAALRAGGSLYRFLARRYGLVDEYAEQYLEVSSPTAVEQRLLGLPARRSVTRVRGVSFTAAGTPFDCFEQVSPAGDFAFYLAGQTNRHVLQASDIRDWRVLPAQQGPPGMRRRRRADQNP